MDNNYDVVIVKDDGIGDFFIFTDALRAYKIKYANKRVLFICNSSFKSIAEKDGFFTDVYGVNPPLFDKFGWYCFKTLKELHKIKADICIYPCWSGHACGELIVRVIRAKEKVGMNRCLEDYRKRWHYYIEKITRRKYTKLVKYEEGKSEVSACERFTREVIDKSYTYHGGEYCINSDHCDIRGKYAVIALSASSGLRVWPAERFAEIIDMIPKEIKVVLTGYGIEDNNRAIIVENLVKSGERIVNLVSKTTMIELTALIQDASFLIGNDSSGVHMAAAMGVPSICIFNGTEYGRFLPYPESMINKNISPRVVNFTMDCYGCQKSCKYIQNGLYACIDNITVANVSKELLSLLKQLN